MENLFSQEFNMKQFLKFVWPAVVSMIFVSLYTIVDGVFVSVLVGSDALASINIVMPIFNVIIGVGIMMATGGNAIVAISLGEGDKEKASKQFSFIMLVSFILGLVIMFIGLIYINDIVKFLGGVGVLKDFSIIYGRILIIGAPVFILKFAIEYYIRTDGSAGFSLFVSVLGGIINMVFDYVFIAILGLGIAGAAYATLLGALISLLFGLWYFVRGKSNIRLMKKFEFDFKLIKETMINGSSEMVTELSGGITTFIFNMIALKYAGPNGVAALSIILYAHFLMISTYLGFTAGVSPLLSYNFGAKNKAKIKETIKYSKKFIVVSSVIVFVTCFTGARYIVSIFVEQSNPTFDIAFIGLKLFSFGFLFIGMNIFASGAFTAFYNGKVSAIISLSRAFIFVLIGTAIFPTLFELNGLWMIVPFAEFCTIAVSYFYIKKYKGKYGY